MGLRHLIIAHLNCSDLQLYFATSWDQNYSQTSLKIEIFEIFKKENEGLFTGILYSGDLIIAHFWFTQKALLLMSR